MSAPELHAEFETAAADARALFTGIGDAASRWRPSPRAWSMAECLDHLNVVGRLYVKAIDQAVEDARRRGLGAAAPPRLGLIERWLVRSMDAPPLFRTKSPRSFRPAAAAPPIAESLPAFLALQDGLADRLTRSEGLDFRRVKVTSPASRRLRLSLGAAFAVTAAHQRRHLWQARQVRSSPTFPG